LTVEEPKTTDLAQDPTPADSDPLAATRDELADQPAQEGEMTAAAETKADAGPTMAEAADTPLDSARLDSEPPSGPAASVAGAAPAEPDLPAAEVVAGAGAGEDHAPAEPAEAVTEPAEAVTEPAEAVTEPAEAVAEPAEADRAEAPVTEAVPAPEASSEPTLPPPPPVVDDRPEPTTMEELLSEQSGEIRSLKHGDVVEGTVVRIDKDEMLVDIGAKSEGVVSNRELYGRNTETQPELSIGDTVLVYVLQPESNEGHAVLSLRRAGLERKWRAMQEQYDEGVIIEAPVIDHNKGGLIVDCGIRGFVPISQIVDFPRRPQNDQPRDAAQEIAEKLQPYVGRKLRLKILEVNRKANRLILSEKVALYEERREKRDELFSSLQVSQKVTGTVRSIAPFGVFVDLGGIDGLVHKSELSWNKVNNPEAGYNIGDEVEAEVIDINHERGRISLSIRRLQPDPWQSTVADLKVGDIVDGSVTKIVNFGAFVRVRDGLEGLIHISELSHQRVAHPGDVVHEGQSLKLKVISLDSERHRLGLSLKQAEEAPQRPARERRARPERGYDASQAIQEPEGGIDNTLAAAFAQVRQQIAAQDAAQSGDGEDGPAPVSIAAVPELAADAPAEATAETAETAETELAADAPAEATAETAETAETELAADAPAEAPGPEPVPDEVPPDEPAPLEAPGGEPAAQDETAGEEGEEARSGD
jgi:small subunit ribosomal protein S1